MDNLKIIQITASFGKTSIKNFIYEILKKKYNVSMTPRSVNTINGIIKDINNNLATNTQIYIVESGARLKGDILVITDFLEPHLVVLGKIGFQHLEYFKTIENIIDTKLEILQSTRLQKAYINIHNTFDKQTIDYIDTLEKEFYPDNLKIIKSDLYSTIFTLSIDNNKYEFNTKLLGKLNPENISVAINIALYFDMDIKDIQSIVERLPFVKHRLEKIENKQKVILDDSYNSNLDGMLEAINVSKNHKGKKIIITCGLIESDEKSNITIAKAIDEVFDIVVITSSINKDILFNNIHNSQRFVLEDKNNIQKLLSSLSSDGDLVLFANDAPSYI
jgi:UDP-N-acetylmuramoyl-tripeptide--D-alanyl-D-alanine ligase